MQAVYTWHIKEADILEELALNQMHAYTKFSVEKKSPLGILQIILFPIHYNIFSVK